MKSPFKIGHFTNLKGGTGCTIILPPTDNVASAAVKGASPGTREIALLAPDKKMTSITALVLSGGSAFGLSSAQAVMEILAERDQGYSTQYGPVPIVPAAVIFDKNVGDPNVYPAGNEAQEALENATFDNKYCGNVGAGTGATVGKWNGLNNAMKGGLGLAIKGWGDLQITVISVVNAVGDVRDMDGRILAGARDDQSLFSAENKPFYQSQKPQVGLTENTVLCAVLMNARLSKLQAFYLAERAHFGIARRIEPSHTSYDGDVAFVVSHPQTEFDMDLLASLMISAVEDSIITAVKSAEGAYGLPAYKDITEK